MYKNILIMSLVISGCATQSVKTPPDFSSYVNGLSYKEQTSKMIHSEYGEKIMNQEPLLSAHKECIKSGFEGVSVSIGGVVVSDPFKLDRIVGDHTVYNFMESLGYNRAIPKDPKKINHRRVMKSKEFNEVAKVLETPKSNAAKCLEDNGWEFVLPNEKN